MGIVTNGPGAGISGMKRTHFGVTEWIPVGHVFTSGALRVAKPDKRIFSRAAERMGILPRRDLLRREILSKMIMLGLQAAGWNAVWYNRGHQAAGAVKPDAVVRGEGRIDCMFRRRSARKGVSRTIRYRKNNSCKRNMVSITAAVIFLFIRYSFTSFLLLSFGR
ncbi:MAG: HAD family hydrolase [Mediterraneibacter faecis]